MAHIAMKDGLPSRLRVLGGTRHGRQLRFLLHGEPEASDVLRVVIKRDPGWSARVPGYLESVSLDKPR